MTERGRPESASAVGRDPSPRLVVMGVSGAGKSRVGVLLAARLGVPFVDGDGLHPEANIRKMAAGIPLTDDDRRPWLDAVGAALAAHSDGVVVACSALARSYRDRLRAYAPDVCFVELQVAPDEARRRVTARDGHFMPPDLVDSQFETLEPLQPGESGFTVPTDVPVADVVERVFAGLWHQR